jgi:hypothetical protein
VWWIAPLGAPANARPIYLIPGIGLNNGYHAILWSAQALALTTHRPVALYTAMIGGNQADGFNVSASGSMFGSVSLDRTEFAGTSYHGYYWQEHTALDDLRWDQVRACPMMSHGQGCPLPVYGCEAWRQKAILGGPIPDPTQPADGACQWTQKDDNFHGSATKEIVDAWQTLIQEGRVTNNTKTDVVALSAGGIRIMGALVNAAGFAARRYQIFYQHVRSVVTLNTPNLGLMDSAKDTLGEFQSFGDELSRIDFVKRYRSSPKLDNIHFWALASWTTRDDLTAAEKQAHVDAAAGNYLAKNLARKYSLPSDLSSVWHWCGEDDWRGDSVVPVYSQFSPWRNSHGPYTYRADTPGWKNAGVTQLSLGQHPHGTPCEAKLAQVNPPFGVVMTAWNVVGPSSNVTPYPVPGIPAVLPTNDPNDQQEGLERYLSIKQGAHGFFLTGPSTITVKIKPTYTVTVAAPPAGMDSNGMSYLTDALADVNHVLGP